MQKIHDELWILALVVIFTIARIIYLFAIHIVPELRKSHSAKRSSRNESCISGKEGAVTREEAQTK